MRAKLQDVIIHTVITRGKLCCSLPWLHFHCSSWIMQFSVPFSRN